MANPMYTHGDGIPVQGSRAVSASMRGEFDLIQTGFDIAQNYYVDSGTANAMVIVPSTGIASLSDGLRFWIKAAAATTGATTVNMGATLGTAVPLKRMDGGAISTDIQAGDTFLAVYKTSTSALHLVGVTKNYVDQLAFGGALPNQAGNAGKFVTTDGTSASWAQILPTQTGNSGKFLTTNGTATSWDYAGISTVGTTVTDNYTIASTTPTIWPCATTALGKSITAPVVTTATPKGLFAVVDNKNGGYPVGWRDSAGALIMAVAAGGVAQVYLEDNSTAAGTWRITGTNLEPGLITIDNTFSSTYASTVVKPFVALDNNKSIHFLVTPGNALYAVAVDNSTATVGTPVLLAVGGGAPNAAFKVSATSAIVFYGSAAAIVVSLTGATTLTAGTAASTGGTPWGAEDFTGAPKIAQLSSTLYLASFTSGTNTSVQAVSVAGAVVTIGAAANIITANSVADSTTTYALTATTALVLYLEGAGSPYTVNAVVVSVSGTICTVGTPAIGGSQSGNVPASCLLSPAKAIFFRDNGSNVNMYAQAVTVSGITVTIGSSLLVESGISGVNSTYTQSSASRYNPHLWPLGANTAGLWYLDGSGISRAVVLSESGGTVTAGTISYRTISFAAVNSSGFGVIAPQGTTEFMSIKEQLASTAGFGLALNACKINGTTIMQGAGKPLRNITQIAPSSLSTVRLTSGDYLILPVGAASISASNVIPVFRSNGDEINYRGEISCPAMSSLTAPISAVTSNRAVILGSTHDGTTLGATTYALRLINVEIAA